MRLVLLGLPGREAAALRIFVNVAFKGWECVVHDGLPGSAAPAGDLYVADLGGLRMSQWSAGAEADLLTLLRGRSALLLLPAHNLGWQQAARSGGSQQLVGLAKPCTSEQVRHALATLAARTDAPVTRAVAPMTPMSPVAPAVRSALPRPLAIRAGDAAPASDTVLQAVFPELVGHPLLGRLLYVVASGRPHELQPTLYQSIVVHPAEGWVAHNTEAGALGRLDKQPGAVSAMNMRELGAAEALERVERRGLQRMPLDTFLWRLADEALGPKMPVASRDAEIRLRSFPGFTRIPGASNLHLQLAAICVRVPQTLSELKAAFPGPDHPAIARFMLLATFSGVARLSLVEAAPAVRRRAAPVRTAAAPAAAGGFMRALLRKLF